MTTKSTAPKRRRTNVVTAAGAAALDFEPWPVEVDTECFPNNEQFTEHGLSHLFTCRVALAMMYKTKAELSEMFEQDVDMDMCALIEAMRSATHFFSPLSKLLDTALARLIVAGLAARARPGKKR